MNQTDYTITKDVSKATHFLAKPDSKSCVKDYIIPGKAYKLIKQKDDLDEEEYFIRSEDSYLTMYYMAHKGQFIIVKEN